MQEFELKEIWIILSVLFLHWVADFVMQDEKWAKNKSHDHNALLSHTLTYSGVVFLGMSLIFYLFNIYTFTGSLIVGLVFSVITFFFHTATDSITSKIVKRQFQNQKFGSKIPNRGAFTTIGFDQVVHYAQLFLTYYFLT